MKPNYFGVDDVMKWKPCYSRKEVIGLFGRRCSVTLVDILTSEKLSDADALWCACKARDDRQRRLFACDCAESVVHLTDDPRAAVCIAVARRYADGLATGEELCVVAAAATNASFAASSAVSAYAAYAAAAAADAAAAYAAAAAAYAAAAAAYAASSADAADAGRETQRNALLMLALAGEIQ